MLEIKEKIVYISIPKINQEIPIKHVKKINLIISTTLLSVPFENMIANGITKAAAPSKTIWNNKEFSGYDIEFRNVSFKYDTANILENLSFVFFKSKT